MVGLLRKIFFICLRSRREFFLPRYVWASSPSLVSQLSIPRVNMMLIHGMSPAFRDGLSPMFILPCICLPIDVVLRRDCRYRAIVLEAVRVSRVASCSSNGMDQLVSYTSVYSSVTYQVRSWADNRLIPNQCIQYSIGDGHKNRFRSTLALCECTASRGDHLRT